MSHVSSLEVLVEEDEDDSALVEVLLLELLVELDEVSVEVSPDVSSEESLFVPDESSVLPNDSVHPDKTSASKGRR